MKASSKYSTFADRLNALRQDEGQEIQNLLELIGRFPEKAFRIFNVLSQPYANPPKKGGAPKKWGQTETLFAWLAVEIEIQLAREKVPGIGVIPAMDAFFKKRGHSPLGTGLYLQGRPHLKIETTGLAKRRHDKGEQILRKSPGLAEIWRNKILPCELNRRR